MKTLQRIAGCSLIAAASGGYVACRSADAVPRAQEPGIHSEGCVGGLPDRPQEARIAKSFRFDVEMWEMPLARAAELYRAGDPIHASIAFVIDERGLAKPLRELAAIDSRVRHAERPPLTVNSGVRGLVPPCIGGNGRESWSDGLRLELGGGAPRTRWDAWTLDFASTWTSPQGERLAHVQGSTPMPADLGIVVWCLPGQSLADLPEPRTAPAVVALVHVVPEF